MRRRRGQWTILLALLMGPAFVGAPRSSAAVARECHESLIPMADGVRLYSNISTLSGRHPTVVELTAYPNTECPTVGTNLTKETSHHFNLAVVSLRGTGSSEGLYDLYGPQTQRDISAVLDWMAGQAWSNGVLVTTGFSGTALATAFSLGHKNVVAVVAGSTCSDLYEWCLRQGGAFQYQGHLNLSLTEAGLSAGMANRVRLGLASRPGPAQQLAAITRAFAEEAARDTRDRWWQERSAFARLGTTNTPVYYMTDNFDIVNSAMYSSYAHNDRAAFLTMGYGHSVLLRAHGAGSPLGSADTGLLPRGRWQQLVLDPIQKFVRHYALGEPLDEANRVTVETTLGGYRSFLQPPGSATSTLDVVRQEASWPLPSTLWERLYLSTGPSGAATSLNDGVLAPTPSNTAGADSAPLATDSSPAGERRGVALFASAPSAGVPADQMQQEEKLGLTYTSPVMTKNLEVTGPIVLRVFASANARDFDWSVALTDVYPDGDSIYVSDGALRASLRRVDPGGSETNRTGDRYWLWYPSEEKEPLPGDQLVEYEIQLQPISNVFQAGHRIRLDLFPLAGQLDSSRTGGLGTLTVATGVAHPSSLLLPVIPDRCQRGDPLDGGPRPARCATSVREALGTSGEG